MYINQCVVGGRVVKEPRQTQDGKGLMFSILMEEPGRNGGETFKTFQDVIVWDSPEVKIHQGDLVVIGGQLARPRKYTNNAGETVWNRSVAARGSGVTVLPTAAEKQDDASPEDTIDAPF